MLESKEVVCFYLSQKGVELEVILYLPRVSAEEQITFLFLEKKSAWSPEGSTLSSQGTEGAGLTRGCLQRRLKPRRIFITGFWLWKVFEDLGIFT